MTVSRATTSRRVHWARGVYALVLGGFTTGVVAQLYLAGLVVFGGAADWTLHTAAVHAFEWLPVMALALAFLGGLPRTEKALPGLLIALLYVQYATAGSTVSAVAALHPANAVAMLLVGAVATARGWRAFRERAAFGGPEA